MLKLVKKLDCFINLSGFSLFLITIWSYMYVYNIYIYIVFYKESESEVKKCKFFEPGGKNKKN